MTTFPVHTIDSAPDGSKASLQNLQQSFGMIPNIAGAMATSPILIGSLVALFQKVHGEGSFTQAKESRLVIQGCRILPDRGLKSKLGERDHIGISAFTRRPH